MEELITFAKRLKETREARGLKQNHLARKIKVTPQTISAYEKADVEGKGKNPTLENAISVAKILGVSLDWLCGIELTHNGGQSKTTYGEIARSLVFAAEEVHNAVLDTVMCTEQVFKHYGADYPYTGDEEVPYTVIVFKDQEIKNFLQSWSKIKALRDADTIDEELYQLWLNKHFSVLDGIIIRGSIDLESLIGETVEIEDDGELPF